VPSAAGDQAGRQAGMHAGHGCFRDVESEVRALRSVKLLV